MSIRETLNENRAVSGAVAVVIILAALGAVGYEVYSFSVPGTASSVAYYTDDNGATWFADSAEKVPPFTDSHGKPAVRCYLTADSGGKEKVAFLEKYPDQVRARLEQLNREHSAGQSKGGPPEIVGLRGTLLVKRPGDADWVSAGSAEGSRIRMLMIPQPGKAQ